MGRGNEWEPPPRGGAKNGDGCSRGVKLVLRMGKLDILYTYGDALLRSARPRRPLACASGARSSAAKCAPKENWGLARRSAVRRSTIKIPGLAQVDPTVRPDANLQLGNSAHILRTVAQLQST